MLRKADHAAFEDYINLIYMQGYEKGQAAAGFDADKALEAISQIKGFDADKALEAISQIKGIGTGKLKEIERVLKGAANGNETQ